MEWTPKTGKTFSKWILFTVKKKGIYILYIWYIYIIYICYIYMANHSMALYIFSIRYNSTFSGWSFYFLLSAYIHRVIMVTTNYTFILSKKSNIYLYTSTVLWQQPLFQMGVWISARFSVTETGANSRIINKKPLGKTNMRISYIFNYLHIKWNYSNNTGEIYHYSDYSTKLFSCHWWIIYIQTDYTAKLLKTNHTLHLFIIKLKTNFKWIQLN